MFRGSWKRAPRPPAPWPETPPAPPPVPRARNQAVSCFQSASRMIAGTRSGGPAGAEAILRHSVGQGHGYACGTRGKCPSLAAFVSDRPHRPVREVSMLSFHIGITQMLLHLLFSTALVLFASLTTPPSHALAQASDVDQPGMIPNPADEQLDPRFQRQVVFFRSNEPPGTIIVHTSERFLYVVQPGGRALRYGVGVGRAGFQWQGLLKISRKEEWPDWTPPEEMIERQPYLPRWMAGGPGNPLGARALYLGNTVYRIHGTNQPQTIGSAVSSGCFRLVNPDVVDLYDRIPVGTKVVVQQQPTL